MQEFRKRLWIRRILAMALAVVMTVTSVPATALAAPGEEQSAMEQNADEDSTKVSDSEDDSTKEQTGEPSGDEMQVTEDADGMNASEETNTGSEDADSMDTSEETNADLEGDKQSADLENADQEAAAPENEAENEVMGDTDAAAEGDQQPEAVYVFVAGGNLASYQQAEYRRGEPLFATESTDADGRKTMEVDSDILWAISVKSEDGSEVPLPVFSAVSELTYDWQDAEGKSLGEGVAPRNAGKYKLAITLPAKAGAYKEAKGIFDFEITKASVRVIPYGDSLDVMAGIKAKDVPLPEFTVDSSDGMGFVSDQTADNKDISVAVDVREAYTDVSITSSDPERQLLMSEDYVVALNVEFIGTNAENYKKNYELKGEDIHLNIADLKETRVKLTLGSEYDAPKYDKQEFVLANNAARKITKITVPYHEIKNTAQNFAKKEYLDTQVVEVVRDQEGKETENVLADAQTDSAWHAVNFEAWKEGSQNYCKLTVGGELEGTPTETGVYAYRTAYAGDDKIYAGSVGDIIVEIGAVEWIVKPSLKKTEFNSAQTVGEVLAEVEPEILGADGEKLDDSNKIPDKLKDHIWGTSYIGANMTQSYEPVFEIVKRTQIKDAAGNVTENREDILTEDVKLGFDQNAEYWVRFTGKKAVYMAGGIKQNEKDINADVNSSDISYQVKTDRETLENEKYMVKLSVSGANAVIDTTKVVGSLEKHPILENAWTRVYDGERLFNSRGDYKKAGLKDAVTSADLTANAVNDFTYTWYESRYKTVEEAMETDADGNPLMENGKPVMKSDFANSFNSRSFISPVNAGLYKLTVTYYNSGSKYAAPAAEVYFVIGQQDLAVSLNNAQDKLEGFTGVSVEEFLADQDEAIRTNVTAVPAGKPETGEWVMLGSYEELEDSPSFYNCMLILKVESQQVDADGNPLKDANGNEVAWEKEYGSFQEGYRYRVVPDKLHSCNRNYKVVNGENIRKDIAVTPMGEAQLEIRGADGKAWTTQRKSQEYNGSPAFDTEFLNALNGFKLYAVSTKPDGTKDEVEVPAAENVELIYQVYCDEDEDRFAVYKGRTLPQDAEEWVWTKNGGTYTVEVLFKGNGKYAPMSTCTLAEVTVTPKKLTVMTPQLTAEAGSEVQYIYDAVYDEFAKCSNLAGNFVVAADIVKGDEDYFKKSSSGWFPAWTDTDDGFYSPHFAVYEAGEELWDGLFTGAGAERYTLRLAYGNLQGICARNYSCVADEGGFITVVRGRSGVASVSVSGISRVTGVDTVTTLEDGSYQHLFVTQSGIPFVTYDNKDGNWVAIRIMAPAEYGSDLSIWNKAVYKKSLEKAGGRIVSGPTRIRIEDEYGDTVYRTAVTAVFNAKDPAEEKAKDADFSIRWEDGYIEQFKLQFSKSTCLGDLRDAVAPKSLAFNSPLKTMAVGEEQELDVKITKVQQADTICLGYEVEKGKEDILHIDEYGKVTALKEGTAKVTVYPMHIVDGIKKKIEGKSVKTATTAVTVKKVTAPKISKITALDNDVVIQYPIVKDGYRREIYVMEGKNRKADDFETAISGMKNGQWEGRFAVAPRFMSVSEENSSRVWDSKKKVHLDIVQLKIEGLEYGKDYTVYLRNVSAVRTLSDGCQVQESYAGTAKGFATTKPQVERLEASLQEGTYLEFLEEENVYVVELKSGSTQIDLSGYFRDKAPAADDAHYEDYVKLSLQPLDPKVKSDYVVPKISYYFCDQDSASSYWTKDERVTIAKNGKITLKQPTRNSYNYYNDLCVIAEDENTGCESMLRIRIVAEADTIKARNTTIQTGQTINLERLGDYKEGKRTLDQNYYDVYGRIDREKVAQQLKDNAVFKLSRYGTLTAYGKGSVKLTLTDTVLEQTVTVNVKSTDLAPVKGLTMTDVIDNRGTVRFERNQYADAYRIDVTDARQKIQSIYLRASAVVWNDKTERWWAEDNGKSGKQYKAYYNYKLTGLTQQSKYNVTVTALFEDISSKPASKAFGTTKLPARDDGLEKDEIGGIAIRVRDKGGISSYPFVSGNSYSLVATPANPGAAQAMTDKLTWSSSDTKVAKVTANAGTFTANLNAVKNGKARIEVKSGITKKVIARYEITVYAVGDAYASMVYYGQNEDLRDEDDDRKETVKEITLGVPVAVELGSGQTQTFRFTAPEEGQYVCYKIRNGVKTIGERWTASEAGDVWEFSYQGSESMTICVERIGSLQGGIANRTVLELNRQISVQPGHWYVFTAPENGYYDFSRNSSTPTSVFDVYEQGGETLKESADYGLYQLQKDEVIYLEARSESSIAAEKVEFISLTDAGQPLEGWQKSWFQFTAPKTDAYEIGAFNNSGNNVSSSIYVYDQTGRQLSTSSSSYLRQVALNAGETVWIRAYTWNYDLILKATARNSYFTFSENNEVSIDHAFNGSNDYVYLTFTAKEAGYYKFASSGIADIGGGIRAYVLESMTDPVGDQILNEYSGDGVSKAIELEAGQTVYLKVRPCDRYAYEWQGIIIRAQKETITELADGSEVSGSVEPGTNYGDHYSQWYIITAEEEARYAVTVTNKSSQQVTLYRNNNINSSGSRMGDVNANAVSTLERIISADEKLYLRIGVYGNFSDPVEFTIKAEKVAPAELTVDAGVAINSKSQWVSFTAEEAGQYNFNVYDTPSESGETGVSGFYLSEYKDIMQTSYLKRASSGSSPSSGMTKVMDQNETILIQVQYSFGYGDLPESRKIKVEKRMPVSAVSAGSQTTVSTTKVGSEHTAIVKFVAEEDGSYTFACSEGTSGVNVSYARVYVDKPYLDGTYTPLTKNSSTGKYSAAVELTAGQTAYLKVVTGSEATSLQVEITEDTI